RFAYEIANKLTHMDSKRLNDFIMPGKWPLRPYYRPVDDDGIAFDFKRIVPVTKTTCMDCGFCAKICPVQSISYEDNRTITGICIKCCACVKHCPVEAKQFDNLNFMKHKKELEVDFFSRRSPECFL
ncbi:MAG TPA: 4Fe-4S binding protein, partial [Fusibacter sp.]|nr:4Fe-4S binding protein [Fusibacter sp.]